MTLTLLSVTPMKKLIVLLSLLVALFGLPGKAMAHSIWTDYQMLAEKLQLTSQFSSEEPFQGAPVRVFAPNSTGKPWLKGKTDEKGNFAFQPARTLTGNWEVRIGDDVEHGDILKVPVTETGVQIDLISQQDIHRPHWWVRQTGVALGAFGGGVGSAMLFRRRRW